MATGQFVAYFRVSTDKQGRSGLGLEAQEAAVMGWLNGGKWTLFEKFTEQESGKRHENRPQLNAALALCKKRKATLVIAKLDRLARNVHFVSGLLESGVNFVCADMPEADRAFLQMAAVFAEWEATKISERTKAALKAKKARGALLGFANPARQGMTAKEAARVRGRKISQEADQFAANTLPVIASIRKAGITSLHGIAKALNDRGIPTARGTSWYAATVKNITEH